VHPKYIGENMTYIEIKTIHGKKYRYLRKSVREGKKVRHVNVKCLGPIEPIYKTGKARKTNASIYVRELSPIDIDNLKQAIKSPCTFTRDRGRILLLSSDRYPAKQIAEKMDCDVRKVRKAIKAFNEIGMRSLERGKAKGAKQKFSQEQRANMLQIASTKPKKLGLHFTTWSLPKLKRYFIENKIVDYICMESIRRIMKSEGIKIKKSKRFQYSDDPEFSKKNY